MGSLGKMDASTECALIQANVKQYLFGQSIKTLLQVRGWRSLPRETVILDQRANENLRGIIRGILSRNKMPLLALYLALLCILQEQCV